MDRLGCGEVSSMSESEIVSPATHRDIRGQVEPRRREFQQVALLANFFRMFGQEVHRETHGRAEAAHREPGFKRSVVSHGPNPLRGQSEVWTDSTQSPFRPEYMYSSRRAYLMHWSRERR